MKRTKFYAAALLSAILLTFTACVSSPSTSDAKAVAKPDAKPAATTMDNQFAIGAFTANQLEIPGGGSWMAITDAGNNGDSKAEISFVDGHKTGISALRMDYTLGPAYQYRYVIMKANFDNDRNFSGKDALSFWIKGSGLKLKVHIGISKVTDYDYHEVLISTVPSEWTRVVLPFNSFKQEGWGAAKGLDLNQVNLVQFQAGSMVSGEKGWFAVDGVEIVRADTAVDATPKSPQKYTDYPVANEAGNQGAVLGIFGTGYVGDISQVNQVEKRIGKKFGQILFFQDWTHSFPSFEMNTISNAGYIPHITWEAWQAGQPNSFKLDEVLSGKWDTYITNWATAAKAFDKPFFLRWGHEFNGNWYPWSVPSNGMNPEKYAMTYRYIHDIFTKVGVTKAIWIWCPNNNSVPGDAANKDLKRAWPGEKYVDWIGVDGYNFGHQPGFDYGWNSFDDLFQVTYSYLVQTFPGKPLMIGEFACGPIGGDKMAWVSYMGKVIQSKYPAFRSIIWFNLNKETDWTLDGTPAMANAFHDAWNSSWYLGSTKSLLDATAAAKKDSPAWIQALAAFGGTKKSVLSIKKAGTAIAISKSAGALIDGEAAWKNDQDLSAQVTLAWTESTFNIEAEIVDDMPMVTSYTTKDAWQGDCLEITFGADNSADRARTSYVKGDAQIFLNPGNGTDNPANVWNVTANAPVAGATIKSIKTKTGYHISATLPWNSFGSNFKLKLGTPYSIDLAIDDADATGKREKQMIWSGGKDFYNNPSNWSNVIFE